MLGKTISAIVIIVLLLPSISNVSAEDSIDLSNIDIKGTINDNFAQIEYSMTLYNPSSYDQYLYQPIPQFSNLFLSNVSFELNGITYYGKVMGLYDAIDTFNDAVESNYTAVLVSQIGDSYWIQLNLGKKATIEITCSFEGYLQRKLGDYGLSLLGLNLDGTVDLTIDLEITASQMQLQSLITEDISRPDITSVTNGARLQYEETDYLLSNNPVIKYNYEALSDEPIILTHNNGTDNFFFYLLSPQISSINDTYAREYIFVIDISGSMLSDGRLTKAKNAFKEIIPSLTDRDMINIIAFDDEVFFAFEENQFATLEVIETAISWVDNLSPDGSTNIDLALTEALGIISSDFDGVRSITLISDGEPTVGEDDPDKIISNVLELNTNNAMVFSVSLGTNTDEYLMSQLAYKTGGNYRIISESTDIAEDLRGFYSEFSNPVAYDYDISVDNAYVSSINTETIDPIFNGSEVVQVGMFTSPLNISTSIFYTDRIQQYSTLIYEATAENQHVERLWAIYTIIKLLNDLERGLIDENEAEERIVKLAIQYGIVVPYYTALVIVAIIYDDSYSGADSNDAIPHADVPDVADIAGGLNADFPPLFLQIFALIIAARIILRPRSKK
ncbi:MAG: VWA domain-containing protein [Candidatus Heimdallarchaeota archaeon]|nr:VWA domain-containing protein [Candidatus Heimdallarchaeota archaeon]